MHSDVLIVGAGPSGLVLALWLIKQGVSVRIVDKAAEAGTTSRALAVQARTVELYLQLGLSDEVVRRGHRTPAVNLWARGQKAAHVPFDVVGRGLTPYPFMLVFPQDEHEALLIEKFEALGGSVERRTELLGFDEANDHVVARLRRPDGTEEVCEARYIVGCDGARSKVREVLGVGFPGGTYRQIFYVADVEAEGPPVDGELHVDLDEADFLAIFPLEGEGHARLIGTVRDERADHAETLKFEDVSDRAIQNMKVKVNRVNWFSTYHVHHRVVDQFRQGRAFLVGDAAHIHSPAGGQGMNTGIGDAINLAWKLAAVTSGRAPDSLLDTYEAERIGFARRLVATTDRAFNVATADGPVADIIRTRLAPFVLSKAISVGAVREYMFRTISQVTLNYRGGPLSQGQVGAVHGGDRLPWAPLGDGDNYGPLADTAWQVHVYGTAREELKVWCDDQALPLRVFEWRSEYDDTGLTRDAVYLLRPDTYVAVAEASGAPDALERYRAARGLSFGAKA